MHCPIANARFPKLLVMVQCEQICFELNGQWGLQKMFGQADVVFQKTIDEAIELGLQTVELKSNWHKTNRVAVKVALIFYSLIICGKQLRCLIYSPRRPTITV